MSVANQIARPVCRPIADYRVALPDGFGGSTLPPEPAQFVINRLFATDTVWVKGTGWAISGGVATNSGTLAPMTQTMVAAVRLGNTYPFSVNVPSNTAGAQLVISVGAQIIYNSIPSAGVLSFSFVSSSASDQLKFQDLNGDGIPGLSIDDVSLVPTP